MGSLLNHIDQLTRRLPFHLDDSEAINNSFRLWLAEPEESLEEAVDLWTYCFVHRYFTWKFIQKMVHNVSDHEALIGQAYQKIILRRASLGPSSRYASWVSVVCKNCFLNFIRGRQNLIYLDDRVSELLVSEAPAVAHDRVGLRLQLQAAIDRLPDYLGEVACLKFMSNLQYEEISRTTGLSVPTLRAYCHKARQKLSEDEQLHAYFQRWDDELQL